MREGGRAFLQRFYALRDCVEASRFGALRDSPLRYYLHHPADSTGGRPIKTVVGMAARGARQLEERSNADQNAGEKSRPR